MPCMRSLQRKCVCSCVWYCAGADSIEISATSEETQVSSLIWGQIIFPNAHGEMCASCSTHRGLQNQQLKTPVVLMLFM